MTTDFTSAILTSQTKASSSDRSAAKPADSGSSDGGVFDRILDNVSKPYTDRTAASNTNKFNSDNYAQKTKEAPKNDRQETNSVGSREEQKTDRTENKMSDNTQGVKEKPETAQTDTRQEADREQNIEDKKPQDTAQNKETQESAQGENKEIKQETDIDTSADSTEQDGQEVKNGQEGQGEQQAESTPNPDSNPIADPNVIANEQILANIVYAADSANTDTDTQNTAPVQQNTVPAGTKAEASSPEAVDSVIKNLTSEEGTAVTTAKTNLTETDDGVSDLPEMNNNEFEVEVDTTNTKKTETNTPAIKTAKENLAADTSRITVNLENTQNTADETPVVTPSDTGKAVEDTPETLIKVTDEVAAQTDKEAGKAVQNKDFSGEIKAKAASKLGDMQGTDTVVTEVRNNTHEQSQTDSNQNNSSLKGNAAEQAVKFSVEDAANYNTTSSDSFMNQLDSKINAASKAGNTQNPMLNKQDIMSQMNAKFSEMQFAGSNKVSIVLQPESLGKVSVEIMNSKDGIVAKMTTDSQQVKELFDKNVEALKSNLSSQGISVNNIKVECTQQSNNAMDFERQQFGQEFSDSNRHNNNHTQNSNETAQGAYNENSAFEDTAEEINNTVEIKNTDTIIKHNGKVDYKV